MVNKSVSKLVNVNVVMEYDGFLEYGECQLSMVNVCVHVNYEI